MSVGPGLMLKAEAMSVAAAENPGARKALAGRDTVLSDRPYGEAAENLTGPRRSATIPKKLIKK